MNSTKPWYASRAIWGALVALGATLASLAGVEVATETRAAMTDFILEIVAAGGGIVALLGRVFASRRITPR